MEGAVANSFLLSLPQTFLSAIFQTEFPRTTLDHFIEYPVVPCQDHCLPVYPFTGHTF